MRPRLCYVLPKYDRDSEEHFNHIYDFLEYLGRSVDIFLIVERGTRPPKLPRVTHVRAHRLRFPFRVLEMLTSLVEARLRGFRTFYVHYSYVGALCAVLVRRVTGGRVYYWNCGLAAMFFMRGVRWQALLAMLTNELPFRLSLRLSDRLVTGTPGMAAYYAMQFDVPRSKIVVLPNEIDLRRFDVAVSREEARRRLHCDGSEVILFLHRLSPRKGADLLPEIFQLVRHARPQTILLIAGDGPSRPDVEGRIRSADLDDSVRFLGWVPNRRVTEFYAAADLYIMPSREEGFPRVLLEAMATGTPFVATDVGGVREVSPEGQERWLVPPDDPQAFARAVIDCLTQPTLRHKQVDRGREHVKRFDLPIVAAAFRQAILGDNN